MQIVRLPRSKRVDWALALDRPTLDEPALRVSSIMSRDVSTCRMNDSLSVPAQIMWDRDCGCVPIVNADGHPVGMITDRDICMAAHTQGRILSEIRVGDICAQQVHTCQPDTLVSEAARTMTLAQVRRLPVADSDGRLVGILALSDLVRHAWTISTRNDDRSSRLAALLESVSRPRWFSTDTLQPMNEDERGLLAEYDAP